MLRRARAAGLTFEASTVKKVWGQEEDDRLKELVELHGTKKWTIIADGLPGRTGKQCRERWTNHLENNIKKGEWTEEEDRLIVHFQQMFGNQWAKITKMLPGRSDNAVKNRFHAFARAWKQNKKGAEENEKTSYFNKLLPEEYADVPAIPCVSNENESFLNETIIDMASKGLDFDFDDGFGDGEDFDDEDPYQEELVAVQEVITQEIPTVAAEIPNDFDFDDGFSDICESDDEDDDFMSFSLGPSPEPKQEFENCTDGDAISSEDASALAGELNEEFQGYQFENEEEYDDIRADMSTSNDLRDTSAQFFDLTICPSPRRNHFKPAIHSTYDNPALQNTYDVLRKKRTARSSPSGSPSPPPEQKSKSQREQSPPRLTHLI